MATSAATMSPAYLNGHPKPQPTKLAITPISAASSPASAASPISSVSTPTSTHQLAIKPAAAAAAAALQATAMASKGSITSKEWVVPPRPKPGRKPATDTPPTKRKAQNRAAQRAFRERRAARVGELEEQLEEQKEEYERAQQQLTDQVQGLDAEVQTLRNRCLVLEDLLEKERKERVRVANELEDLRRRWRGGDGLATPSRNGSFAAQQGRTPHSLSISSQHPTPRGSVTNNTSDHRNSATAFSISQIISPPDSSSPSGAPRESSLDPSGCGNCGPNGSCACIDEVLANAPVGCGKCSIGTKCECLEAVLKGPAPTSESELKRKPSSVSVIAPEEKRQKIPEPYPHEVDFTTAFAKKKKDPVTEPALYQPVVQPTVPPRDACGFCEEGTYCMCAEAAASQNLPPVSQQVQTPPPSENDVGPQPIEATPTGAVKLPGINSLNRTPISAARPSTGCGPKGPGSCSQCLNDPKSGLFCRSLAANFSRNSDASSGGCCGGSAGSGCCKTAQGTTPTDSPSVSVSCADAYKTLSSHRNFDKAADEIGTWLPRLRAAPQPTATANRLPIEVQVASIMSVLREFDIRFGRDA